MSHHVNIDHTLRLRDHCM